MAKAGRKYSPSSLTHRVPSHLAKRAERTVLLDEDKRIVPPDIDASSPHPWHVAYTNIRCERRAYMGLTEKGITAYLPVRTKWVTHARVKRQVEQALFPRYLFFRLGADNSWFDLKGVDGIECVLRVDGAPAAISAGGLADLASAQRSGAFDETIDRAASMRVGEPVKIARGPLEGFLATVRSVLGAGRVEVVVDFMGMATPATVSLADVRAVCQDAA